LAKARPLMADKQQNPVRFAVVGCGLIGKKRVLALKQAQVLYTCDLDPSRATDLAKLVPGCQPITDFHVALKDPAVEAVVVATLNASLAPITLAAVTAGKHVLVEKPGALNAAQLREIQAVANKNGVKVRLGYNHRFHPALQKARALIDKGELGPLMFMRARY